MTISVIIPAFNSQHFLMQCLDSILHLQHPPDEIIVVDDGSTEGTSIMQQRSDIRFHRLPGPSRGPAFARNRGAELARGDILVFLDSDVMVHSDTLTRIKSYFQNNPRLSALFGSYDDTPTAPGLTSRFKNLFHHYTHQHSKREAVTFWTGCGAIRRHLFQAIAGFDEAFTRPAVEDIEFGGRLLKCGGEIWLCSDVQVTHQKAWSLISLIKSDIFDRAIPWTQFIVQQRSLPTDLNLQNASRFSAFLAWSSLSALFFSLLISQLLWIPVLCLAGLLLVNRSLYMFFYRKGSGALFTVGAFFLHVLYLLYSSFIFITVGMVELIRHFLRQSQNNTR